MNNATIEFCQVLLCNDTYLGVEEPKATKLSEVTLLVSAIFVDMVVVQSSHLQVFLTMVNMLP